MPEWQEVTSRVTQRSVLCLVLFNMFNNDLDARIEHFTIKFADVVKPRRTANTLENRSKFRDLDLFASWLRDKRINTKKCEVLHLGKNNQEHKHRMGSNWLGSSTAEKYQVILVNHRSNMSQQCDSHRKRKCTWELHGCLNRYKAWKVIVPINSVLLKTSLQYCVLFWALHFRKDTEKLRSRIGQQNAKVFRKQAI